MINQMEITSVSVWRGRRHELSSIRYWQLGMLSGDHGQHDHVVFWRYDHLRLWRYDHLMDNVATWLSLFESSLLE